jgi:hypothetical protein
LIRAASHNTLSNETILPRVVGKAVAAAVATPVAASDECWQRETAEGDGKEKSNKSEKKKPKERENRENNKETHPPRRDVGFPFDF